MSEERAALRDVLKRTLRMLDNWIKDSSDNEMAHPDIRVMVKAAHNGLAANLWRESGWAAEELYEELDKRVGAKRAFESGVGMVLSD